MSADLRGDWIVTQGTVYLRFLGEVVEGELVYEDSQGELIRTYAKLNGHFLNESELRLEVTHEDAAPFTLSGHMYELSTNAGPAFTVILTDGTTVLGLASGTLIDSI